MMSAVSWLAQSMIFGGEDVTDLHEQFMEILGRCAEPGGGVRPSPASQCATLLSTLSAIQLVGAIGSKSRLDAKSIASFLLQHVQVDGSVRMDGKSDLRYSYCTIAALKLLDLLHMCPSQMIDWIESCQCPEGCFACMPGAEGHAGFTYCAVASLMMMGRKVARQERLGRWLKRRITAVNGRPGKPKDSCYLWWNGATMEMLGICGSIPNYEEHIVSFLRTCSLQGPNIGGFSKHPGGDADVFHSYLALASISLLRRKIDPTTLAPRVSANFSNLARPDHS